MNLNVLKYALAIASEQNFTRAAQKLFISQPSLSQSILALEKELGTPIFDRGKTPLEPTVAGKLFLEWAKNTLRSQESMQAMLEDYMRGTLRRLSVASFPYRCNCLFPDAIRTFYQIEKNCIIQAYEGSHEQLMDMLAANQVDVVITAPTPDTASYISVPIATEPLLLAAGKEYTFNAAYGQKYPAIKMEDLLGKPFILLDDAKYLGTLSPGTAARSIFSRCNTLPQTVLECQSVELAAYLAATGIGISLIPEIFAKSRLMPSNVMCYSISDIPLDRSVSAVYRSDRYLSEDGKLFINVLKDLLN